MNLPLLISVDSAYLCVMMAIGEVFTHEAASFKSMCMILDKQKAKYMGPKCWSPFSHLHFHMTHVQQKGVGLMYRCIRAIMSSGQVAVYSAKH